jgi:hypothetical protein
LSTTATENFTLPIGAETGVVPEISRRILAAQPQQANGECGHQEPQTRELKQLLAIAPSRRAECPEEREPRQGDTSSGKSKDTGHDSCLPYRPLERSRALSQESARGAAKSINQSAMSGNRTKVVCNATVRD